MHLEEQGDKGIRLQKYMADCGIASRRHSAQLIAEGRVKVNGIIPGEAGFRVYPGRDKVEVDGKLLQAAEEKAYIAFYKPPFVVSSLADPQGRPTVLDYFKELGLRIYPVGRLDFESEGLLLMTNDGHWSDGIAHPRNNLEKEYYIKVKGNADGSAVKLLERGVMVDGRRTWPAAVSHLRAEEPGHASMHITIHEGRNRQVRKMCEAVGLEVVFLKRVRIGSLLLGDMKPGTWRYLTHEEIDGLAERQESSD